MRVLCVCVCVRVCVCVGVCVCVCVIGVGVSVAVCWAVCAVVPSDRSLLFYEPRPLWPIGREQAYL